MFSTYLYFSIGIFLLLNSLIVYSRRATPAFIFLACHLLFMGIGIVTRSFIANGMIIEYPHLFNIISPLHFLYGPLYYFFMLMLFFPRYLFKIRDLVHFLPFIINLVDFIPFFVLNADSKRLIIAQGTSTSYFGISQVVYNSVKSASFIFYMIAVAWLYMKEWYTTNVLDSRQARIIHGWLRIDFMLKTVAVVSAIYIMFIQQQQSFTAAFYLLSIDAIFNIVLVYVRPSILKGFGDTQRLSFAAKPFFGFSRFWLWRLVYVKKNLQDCLLISSLDHLMQEQKVFLHLDQNTISLASRLRVDPDWLDQCVHRVYGCSTEDFIGFHRLCYLLTHLGYNEHSDDVPLLKRIFLSGFDAVTSLQLTLMKFHRYNKKNEFHFNAQSLEELESFLDSLGGQA
jgi:hypothetical protein